MSSAPNFFFDAPFPFCVPSMTTAEIDDAVTNGFGSDPDAFTFAGRIDDLTLIEAWKLFWLKKTIAFNFTSTGNSGIPAPSSEPELSGAFPAPAPLPSARVCGYAGEFYETSPIPETPVDGDAYIEAQGEWRFGAFIWESGVELPGVIYDTDKHSYTVLFSVDLVFHLVVWFSGEWFTVGDQFLSSNRSGYDTTPFSMFGGLIRIYYFGESGNFPNVTLEAFSDEDVFTIP